MLCRMQSRTWRRSRHICSSISPSPRFFFSSFSVSPAGPLRPATGPPSLLITQRPLQVQLVRRTVHSSTLSKLWAPTPARLAGWSCGSVTQVLEAVGCKTGVEQGAGLALGVVELADARRAVRSGSGGAASGGGGQGGVAGWVLELAGGWSCPHAAFVWLYLVKVTGVERRPSTSTSPCSAT